jgi:hypothetical protein
MFTTKAPKAKKEGEDKKNFPCFFALFAFAVIFSSKLFNFERILAHKK